jgi:predicted molibdopterin-dependent oxidoreductase YjgC
LRALVTERVAPGVVYTTFQHPGSFERRVEHVRDSAGQAPR